LNNQLLRLVAIVPWHALQYRRILVHQWLSHH